MIWLLACGAPPAPRLDAPSLVERSAAFFALDIDEFGANAAALLARTHDEPDPELRREILRQIGLTGDPTVRTSLVAAIDTEDRDVAIESLGYDRPEGCAILADRWVAARAGQPDLWAFQGQGIGAALTRVFQDLSPECRPALRAVAPADAARLVGEPASGLLPWDESRPSVEPPVPVRGRVDLTTAAGIWASVEGSWTRTTPPTLRLSDQTELVLPGEPADRVEDGRPVTVVGIVVPMGLPGDPDPRGRVLQVHRVVER